MQFHFSLVEELLPVFADCHRYVNYFCYWYFQITLATFATYVLVSETHYLDAGKAFVALSLFNILRFPMNLLPMIVSLIVQVGICS